MSGVSGAAVQSVIEHPVPTTRIRHYTYAQAAAAGNILLCLPLELRQEIYLHAIRLHQQCKCHKDHGKMIWAADIRAERPCNWLPPICCVSDDMFHEALPVALMEANLVVDKPYTAYNLAFFLAATETHSRIRSLTFGTPASLGPSFAGSQLLTSCFNLRHVTLIFAQSDFVFEEMNRWGGSGRLDKKAFTENHAFRQLLALRHIQRVDLRCPFFSVRGVSEGAYSTFFGIAPWLKKKFSRRGLKVQIVCSNALGWSTTCRR